MAMANNLSSHLFRIFPSPHHHSSSRCKSVGAYARKPSKTSKVNRRGQSQAPIASKNVRAQRARQPPRPRARSVDSRRGGGGSSSLSPPPTTNNRHSKKRRRSRHREDTPCRAKAHRDKDPKCGSSSASSTARRTAGARNHCDSIRCGLTIANFGLRSGVSLGRICRSRGEECWGLRRLRVLCLLGYVCCCRRLLLLRFYVFYYVSIHKAVNGLRFRFLVSCIPSFRGLPTE